MALLIQRDNIMKKIIIIFILVGLYGCANVLERSEALGEKAIATILDTSLKMLRYHEAGVCRLPRKEALDLHYGYSSEAREAYDNYCKIVTRSSNKLPLAIK